MTPIIRTKILATLGPAVGNVDTLLKLFEEGVDICRLNFSHGDLDQHLQMLRVVREAAARWQRPIAVLGDLCGPKIRLGIVADEDGSGGMRVNVGDELIFQRAALTGGKGRVSTTYPHFVDDVQVGHKVLIEDGLLRFICTEKSHTEVVARCTVGGIVKSSKGINLPNSKVRTPSITEKDWACVDWAVENDLDYLALSFVRKADDIKLLRGHLQYKKSNINIIAKIEKAEALAEIDGIMDATDGLMVARGDLGVEMDVAQVPIIQKDLVRRCQMAGKPCIVATQMLQSMIEQATPTRAEVSDVANAIFDGTDAVMLSAETSVGKFPLQAVHTMAHVAQVTEAYLDQSTTTATQPIMLQRISPATALAQGAWRIVRDLGAKLIVVWSQNGHTARVFSKHRFPVPIIAFSSNHRALRRMAIHYGVIPQEMARPEGMNDLIAQVDGYVIEQKLAQPQDRIVLVAGWSAAMPDTMNGIIIHTVGEQWRTLSPTDRPLMEEGDHH
jgi:pyruvate kinase